MQGHSDYDKDCANDDLLELVGQISFLVTGMLLLSVKREENVVSNEFNVAHMLNRL